MSDLAPPLESLEPLAFEYVEGMLAAALQNLRLASITKATLEPIEFKQIQKEQHRWLQNSQAIESLLATLEEQGITETAGLHLNLKPMLQHLDYLNQILETCHRFQELSTYLIGEMAEVKEASIALTKQILPYHLPKFEAGLEQFIDRCDQTADQLDALELQGHNVAPLVQRYEQWVAMVEQFGDILDERTETLVLKPKAGVT